MTKQHTIDRGARILATLLLGALTLIGLMAEC